MNTNKVKKGNQFGLLSVIISKNNYVRKVIAL